MDEALKAEFILIELQETRDDDRGRPHALCPWCGHMFHVLKMEDGTPSTCELDHCWELHKEHSHGGGENGPPGALSGM